MSGGGEEEQTIGGAGGVGGGVETTKEPGGCVEDDRMRDTPPYGPEWHGLHGQIFKTIQFEPHTMRALDPYAHRVQLRDSCGVFCQTHGELLVGWGGGEVFGAEAVDDDETAMRGKELGHCRHKVTHVLDAVDYVDCLDCEYDVECGGLVDGIASVDVDIWVACGRMGG